ncbi:MAG TPA: 50S ribosomal protein L6 [Gammaproteobacteria bacterium]|nr:50S ribosomal protein L6 [Gammaproteobacteria bacterium]
MTFRIAHKPIELPSSVKITSSDNQVTVTGPQGNLTQIIPTLVTVSVDKDTVLVKENVESKTAITLCGTIRALLNNHVIGVTQGFNKKLQLVGVGYRAAVQGNMLNLTLGFSHPVKFMIPKGITIETPSQTEIIVKGINKQQVGQVAANIRSYRPPEPYKGKGVRYVDEVIIMKETKKK